MNSILRNTLAFIVGTIVGALCNGLIIQLGPLIIPNPEGVDNSSMESLKNTIHLFQAKHFIVPFLAHSIGTFIGAFLAVKLCVSHHLKIALIISALFFIGGAYMVKLLPAPMWFNVTDLVLAYFPMGYLAFVLGKRKQ